MDITDVRIKKVNSDNKIKAIASVTFDNEFVVREIKVLEGRDGELFIAMPSRKNKFTGEHRDICHPINSPAREKIQSAIFEAYKNAPEAEVNEENNDSEVNE